MKIHRFYVGQKIELKNNFWVHDDALLHQWHRVLRFRSGQQVALFNGAGQDRLYKISELSDKEAHVTLVTDMVPQLPKKEVHLLWAILKKDKNDWVLQKCTEIGVSHFMPIITDRCERSDLSQNQLERWQRIAIEAAEQCGRSDIPTIREPMRMSTALDELQGKVELLVCEQSSNSADFTLEPDDGVAVLVGPEGGWSDEEKRQFDQNKLNYLNLHDLTLRAETACVVAASHLLK